MMCVPEISTNSAMTSLSLPFIIFFEHSNSSSSFDNSFGIIAILGCSSEAKVGWGDYAEHLFILFIISCDRVATDYFELLK